MAGEIIQFFGVASTIIGFILSIVVMFGILATTDASLTLWILYILELVLLIGGAILQGLGKHL